MTDDDSRKHAANLISGVMKKLEDAELIRDLWVAKEIVLTGSPPEGFEEWKKEPTP